VWACGGVCVFVCVCVGVCVCVCVCVCVHIYTYTYIQYVCVNGTSRSSLSGPSPAADAAARRVSATVIASAAVTEA